MVYERLPGDTDGRETTLNVTTGGKDVWVGVELVENKLRRRQQKSG